MNKTQVNQLKAGSILSYIQMFLNIAIGLLYTPIMIRLLGQSEYGLYQTVTSTISMLSVLNLGFNAGYIRYYAGYKIKSDYENIYKLNGLFLLIFTQKYCSINILQTRPGLLRLRYVLSNNINRIILLDIYFLLII